MRSSTLPRRANLFVRGRAGGREFAEASLSAADRVSIMIRSTENVRVTLATAAATASRKRRGRVHGARHASAEYSRGGYTAVLWLH